MLPKWTKQNSQSQRAEVTHACTHTYAHRDRDREGRWKVSYHMNSRNMWQLFQNLPQISQILVSKGIQWKFISRKCIISHPFLKICYTFKNNQKILAQSQRFWEMINTNDLHRRGTKKHNLVLSAIHPPKFLCKWLPIFFLCKHYFLNTNIFNADC